MTTKLRTAQIRNKDALAGLGLPANTNLDVILAAINAFVSTSEEVIFVANYAALPATGVASIVYLTMDDNKMFRWDSAYVLISGLPLSYLDTDPTLAANSDAKVASQKATAAYAKSQSIKYSIIFG